MRKLLSLCMFVAVSLSCVAAAQADVTLPKIFGSNMVLQQGQPIKVWGWADAGESVSVEFDGQTATAVADAKGNWRIELPAKQADGKTHTLTVSGENEIALKNILIGEVWLGSGQSNMAWTVKGANDSAKEIAAAKHPQLRLFLVPRAKSATPAKDITGGAWQECSPNSVPGFSATAYFFARELQQKLGVPVGIIASSWGGTRIEPWTPKNGTNAVLYNGMIHPLAPFSLRGVIWYQGESNVLSLAGLKYHDMKKQLIEDWRAAWKNDSLSFYYVHIAPWGGRYAAGELPKLWEAQSKSLSLPHTGMAVITDAVDNINDIHPKSKQVVGKRLALWALAKNYEQDIVYSGPLYKSMKVEANKIRIEFSHAAGLASRDDKALSEFTIAAADGKFVPAKATIDGNTVLVEAEGIAAPKHVRFGWHKTCDPNLVNKAGLPAAPFHTDDWQGSRGK
ncbi:MAG: sialate O-acetylesterase [Planctomycetaceae bacterium]|jgi:sialate O-acetylesterase|nr:sialate O-acetylesterase [Planctomycetaceae bacterium]MBT6155780.1 sialate O-acetylesterase [Planctomycetaceae bacterium]MBT6483524.1 sialate O-acetylesterase [Planctomycetaceae bacterium]MBT6493151.1 sialate O-acetylesterase [Planctomycetaceae bacterium]